MFEFNTYIYCENTSIPGMEEAERPLRYPIWASSGIILLKLITQLITVMKLENCHIVFLVNRQEDQPSQSKQF